MKRTSAFVIVTFTATLRLFFSCSRSDNIEQECLSNPSESVLRTYDQALSCAEELLLVLESKIPTKSREGRRIEAVSCITTESTKSSSNKRDTLAYVFNFENNEGFAIIAANKVLPPMLAITEKGHYEPGEITGVENFDYFMETLLGKLSALESPEELGRGGILEYYYTHDTIGSELDPLMTSLWGQDDIYGSFCQNSLSGCAPTAIAQVMNYHQHPASFVTTVEMGNAYVTYPLGSSIPLNWDYVQSHIITHTASQACSNYHNTISAMLREIGSRVNTFYYTNGNGSPSIHSLIPSALSSFGYASHSLESAIGLVVKNSIVDYGPVLLYGFQNNDSQGHAWVADGYKDWDYITRRYDFDYNLNEYVLTSETIDMVMSLHFNWGWNGLYNGYFAFDVYDVSNPDSYDDSGLIPSIIVDFSSGTMMVRDIYPISNNN